MKLKTRIAQILSVGLAANVLLGLIVQTWVVLPSFEQLEHQEAQRVATRYMLAIDQEIQHLDLVCGDWSNCTEMYTSVTDRRQEFIDSSLDRDSLLNLDLDLLYIADSDKRCVRGVALTPGTEEIASHKQFERLFGPASDLMTTPCEVEKVVSGITSTDRGPMIVSARPILTSNRAGPSRGVIIMGRLLNEARVKNLGFKTCADLRCKQLPDLHPMHGPDARRHTAPRTDRSHIISQLRQGRSPHILVKDKWLRVSSLIPGILGEPAVLIEATIPRDIVERGRISSGLAVISIVAASVFFMALTRLFMHTAVSRPIMKLVDRVVAIASNPQIEASDLRTSRDDEIGLLSNQFYDSFAGLQYRDHLLSAVAEAAGGLLCEADLNVAMAPVVASLGRAIHADSVTICRLTGTTGQQTHVVQHTSWVQKPQSKTWPVKELDAASIEEMRKGQSIESPVSSLREQLRTPLEIQGIRSILLVPITVVHESLWGFIAFISASERRWSDTEQSLLRAIADNMGSALLREMTEDALLEARQAANDANRAKSDFLAKMSHEIRTPMNGVIGMLDLLEKTSLDDRQQRYAQMARTSATALLGIIDDILDFSKIEAGKMELSLAEIDLRDVVRDAVGLLANRAAEKRLELICDIKQDVPHIVRGDALRLRQVLVNLVNNAVKFTDRGTVSVDVRVERAENDLVRLHVAVKDTGCGIPEHLQSKLFQVFSQVHSPGARRSDGSGLGLVICKRLVEMMGGEIGVNSRAGQGSEFWFTACLAVVSAAPVVRPRATPSWKAAMIRVLAVDDNPTNLEILQGYVASWGFHVDVAGGATEALEALHAAATANNPFDVAVLDMDMPDMTGIELARAIQASGPLRHTTLILLSSIAELPSRQDLLACGFVAGLTKPVRQSDLFDALVSAMPGAAVRPGQQSAGPQALPPDENTTALRRKTRILVAEDNDINQEVIRTILTQSGYGEVDVVEDGRQAVEAVQRTVYDVVLMDCQMPVLDGFAASRTIRAMEKTGLIKTGGRQRLPIVALTANALSGDREQCLASGMSDYLNKPVQSGRLMELLDRILAAGPAAHDEPTVPAPPIASVETPQPDRDPQIADSAVDTDPRSIVRHLDSEVPVFEPASALKRCMNDEAFLQKMLNRFSRKLPKDIEELERTVAGVDPQKVAFLAHALKGAAANLSAERLRMAASDLEEAGKSGDFSRIPGLLDAVKDEARCFLESVPDAQPQSTAARRADNAVDPSLGRQADAHSDRGR